MLSTRSVTSAALAAALLLATGCGGSSAPAGKFNQTWTTNYGKTTCKQWLSVMTGQQTFAAAADMLVNARATVDKNAALPSDDLINSFKAEIDQACQPIATMTITDAATGFSMLSGGRYAP